MTKISQLAKFIPTTAGELLRNVLTVVDKNFAILSRQKVHTLPSATFRLSETTVIALPISLEGRAFRVQTSGDLDTSSFSGTVSVKVALLAKGVEVTNTYFGQQWLNEQFTVVTPYSNYGVALIVTAIGTGSVEVSIQSLIEVIE